MPLKNYKDVLIDATRIPAAIERKIPVKVPSLANFLAVTATKLPTLPDFPFGLPALPSMDTKPVPVASRSGYIRGVEVVPVSSPVRVSNGGVVPLLFE